MGKFVHLHLHSEYSLLDGACRIADIPKKAKALGHDAVAITDHGVMYGVIDFYKACKQEGIKPIIGCEVYVAPGDRHEKNGGRDNSYYHLILLCENKVGYQNLIYLVSNAYTEGFYAKPRIDIELLRSHSEGLIALSGCLAGFISKSIIAGNYEAAENYALTLLDIFGRGRFYLELQDHSINDQKIVNQGLLRISQKHNIELVATNDIHYLNRSDAEAQAILMCIQTNNVITDGRPIGFETNEFYYKSTEQMEALFGRYNNAISNTVKIANMCNFDFEFGNIKLPKYVPITGETPSIYLEKLAYNCLDEKINNGHILLNEKNTKEVYENRIKYELSVIEKMGYSEYYLIVWDFVHKAKQMGIPVGPGRGSGAGSLVAFSIGITDIDPIRFDLLFERFLNPERVSMPDFDIDFCYERRDEVVQYVKDYYGEDHVSQIATFGTMAARAVVRDVGRALGLPYSFVDGIVKLMPRDFNITLEEALKNKELKARYDNDEQVKQLFDTSLLLEGMPRHASVHAAGVVITDRPITDYVPVAVNNGTTVTQYNMDEIAELGLLKFDFLALRYLTIISKAEAQIKENNPDFDISMIPLDDKTTYDIISQGKTYGVFQLESNGMRQMLMQLKPERIDDIIAAIALYRPGPMDSIPTYIARRHNPSTIKYDIECLAPILDSTYGCIVYQEQVMQIFTRVAGYSLGRADVVRRAISKKKASVLESERASFIEGAAKNNIPEKYAIKLFNDIADFANYAFNKSHAAAYAILSYRTAYLKAHYSLEYMCALMSSVYGSVAKTCEYIAECNQNGIKVLPPDINKSYPNYKSENGNIRFALLSIKGIGYNFAKNIVIEREKGGDYKSLEDFINRVSLYDINKKQLEMLIKAGCFDTFGIYRSRLLAGYETLLEQHVSKSRNNLFGQLDLFSQLDETDIKAPEFVYPNISEFSPKEKLMLEKESAGLYLSGHILDNYSNHLKELKIDKISDILSSFESDDEENEINLVSTVGNYKDKDIVSVAGVISKRINKQTKNGDAMSFVMLEDGVSEIELIIFPKVLERYDNIIQYENVIYAKCSVSYKDDGVKLLVQSLEELVENGKEIPRTLSGNKISSPIKKVYVRVDSTSSFKYRDVLSICNSQKGQVPCILFDQSKNEYLKNSILMIRANESQISQLQKVVGINSVVVRY